MTLKEKLVVKDTVFTQEIDDELVILDMESENYFGLDETGTAIWQAVKEKESLKEVLELLLEQYDVDKEVLKQDLFDFVKELIENGLVEVVED
jgi:hypothetical protein